MSVRKLEPVGGPEVKVARDAADVPGPKDNVPEGEGALPGVHPVPDKKRTRRTIIGPVKNRPKCVGFPQGLIDDGNFHQKVYYPGTGDAKYGYLVIRKEGRVALFEFTENEDGTVNWHPRVTRGAGGKGTIFHYDMPQIAKAIAHEVARAIMNVADMSFGTERAIEARTDELKKADPIKAAEAILDVVGGI
jgi:hypothetical protein